MVSCDLSPSQPAITRASTLQLVQSNCSVNQLYIHFIFIFIFILSFIWVCINLFLILYLLGLYNADRANFARRAFPFNLPFYCLSQQLRNNRDQPMFHQETLLSRIPSHSMDIQCRSCLNPGSLMVERTFVCQATQVPSTMMFIIIFISYSIGWWWWREER